MTASLAQTISANPGQSVTIVIQTLDGYGARSDGYEAPQIDYVFLPDLSIASGYPLEMSQLSTGLYYHTLTLLPGSSGIGTYIVSISYADPESGLIKREVVNIQAFLPFGNSTVIPI